MNFYWVYDIPNVVFFLITVLFFILFSLLGSFFFSERLEKKLGLTEKTNQIVEISLSLSGVFYGITLGLIAVGTFENFNTTEAIVSDEAASLAAMYNDVNTLQGKEKIELSRLLVKYTHYVIEKSWPLQQQGIIPKGGTRLIDVFQKKLAAYQPVNSKDEIMFSELIDQNNVFLEKRRLRLNSVASGLPSTIWFVLFLGAFVNIILTWLLVIKNKKLDIILNTLIALLLGSLIFLIGAMDNPFRGSYSVTPDAYELVLETMD
jgi:Protein of unknown function (DUF4239)